MDRKKLSFESNLKNNCQDLIVGIRETKAKVNEIRSRCDSIKRGSSKQRFDINNKSYEISTKTSGSFIITKDNDVSYLKKKNDDLQFRIDSQEAKLKARDKEIAYQQSQIKQLVLEINEVQIIEDNYKEEISGLNKELSQWKEKYFLNLKEYQYRQAQQSRQAQQEQAKIRKKYEEIIEQQQREMESIEIRFENERENLYKALDLQNMTEQKNNEMNELIIKLEESESKTHKLQERIQGLEKNKEELQLTLQQQTQKLNEQITKNNNIEQQKNKEIQNLQSQLLGKDKQLNTLQIQIGEQRTKTNQQDQEKLQHLENLNNQLVQEVTFLEDEVSKLQKQAQDFQKVKSQEKENENLQMNIQKQKIQNHDLEQQLILLYEEMNSLKAQNQNNSKIPLLENEIHQYQKLLSELQEQNRKLLIQQVDIEELNEELIILKKNNQELKQQHAEDFKVIEYKCSRIKQLELEINQMRQENLILSNQQQQFVELEYKIQELKKQIEKLLFTNKEKDAEIVNQKGLLQKLDLNLKDFDQLITEQKAENKEYQIQNKQLSDQVVLFNTQNQNIQEELQVCQKEIDALNRIHEEILIKIDSLENEKQQIQNNFDHYQKEIQKKDAEKLLNNAQQENENEKLYQQRIKLQEKIRELEETANLRLIEITQLKEQDEELLNQVKNQQLELETLNIERQNLNLKSQEYQNNLLKKDESLNQLQSQYQKLIDQNEEQKIIIKKLNNTYQSQIQQQQERIQELEQNLEAQDEGNDQQLLINENELLKQKNQDLESKLNSQIDDDAEEIDKLKKQLLHQEQNNEELKLKLNELQTLKDDLQKNLEEIERLNQIQIQLQEQKKNDLINQATEKLNGQVDLLIEQIKQLEEKNQNYEAQLKERTFEIKELNLQSQLIETKLTREIEDLKNKSFEAIQQMAKYENELLKFKQVPLKQEELPQIEQSNQQGNFENEDLCIITLGKAAQQEENEEEYSQNFKEFQEEKGQTEQEELQQPQVNIVQNEEIPNIELDNQQQIKEVSELRDERKQENNSDLEQYETFAEKVEFDKKPKNQSIIQQQYC